MFMSGGYVPEKFWNDRVKMHGDLADGYLNQDYQNYEVNIRMKKVFEILGDVSGLRVLDAGCGTGRWSVEFAKRGAIVVGLDISYEMLKLAKKRAEMHGVSKRVTFINKKIEEINYIDDFDVVLCVTVLQHIVSRKNLEKAVKKLVRACKVGGTILIVESTVCDKNKLLYKFIQLGSKLINRKNMALNYLSAKYKHEWINLFENEGVKFIRSEGVSFFGIYVYQFVTHTFGNSILNRVTRLVCEILDMKLAKKKIFDTISQPTIFIFKK